MVNREVTSQLMLLVLVRGENLVPQLEVAVGLVVRRLFLNVAMVPRPRGRLREQMLIKERPRVRLRR